MPTYEELSILPHQKECGGTYCAMCGRKLWYVNYENAEWHQRNYPYLTFKTDEEVIDFYENTHFIKNKELYEKPYIWIKYVSGSYESFYFETEDEVKAKYNEIKEKICSIDI